MKTKLFTLFFALMASVGTIFAESGTCGDNLTWDLTGGVLTISGTGAMENYASSSSSPWYSYRYSIQSIVIENGVTSIGNYAFYLYNCTALTNVTIPNSVISIGNHAFSSYSLTSIEIPNSVISIGDYAFSSSNLTSIEIPNSVTSIGNYAFGWCRNLSSVIVGSSVTSIGNDAFTSCSSLTSVTLNSNTIASAEYSYNSNIRNIFGSKITEYIIGDSVTRIGSHAFQFCSDLISVSISNSVTSIGGAAFYACQNLTSITIPNSVTSIEGYAFSACYSLNSITLSNNVDSINEGTFESDSSLTSITIPNSVTYIGEHAFWGCTGLTSIDIPSSVQYIEASGTFTGCTNLVSINVASNNPYYTSIDGILFSKNLNSIVRYPEGKSYTEYTIPDGIHYIWNYAFSNCNKLTSVSLPSSITHIYSNAFDGCSGLTNIILPNSVTSFGYYVFKGCNSLTSITCEAETPPTCRGNYTFDYVDKSIPLYVPAQSVAAYQAADGWSEFTNILPIEGDEPCVVASGTCGENLTWTLTCDSVLTISGTGEMTDYNYESSLVPWKNYRNSIKSLIIENGVTRVDGVAFQNYKSLTYITIPNSVTKGINFAGCYDLISIDVESGNKNYSSLDGVLFNKGKTTLITYPAKNPRTEYNIPNSVKNIQGGAFRCNTNLVSITIPNSVESIGKYTFASCSNLNSISIPTSVTSIELSAFSRCTGLTSVTIPNSVTYIGVYPFANCTNLTSINVATDNPNYSSTDGVLFNKDKTSLIQYPGGKQGEYAIPNSVTSIGEGAFMGCAGLTSIEIPNSITSISSMVFDHCTSLSSVILPDGVTTIEYQAFYSCTNLTSVTIPSSVTSIGNHVFSECSNLTLITNYAVEPQAVTQYMFMINWATNHLSNCTLYVPAQSIAAYQTADVWKEFGNILPIEGDEPCVVASGTCGTNLTWTLTCDSVLTISGTGEMTDWQDTYYTPWYDIRFSVKQIVIEEGVTSIGKWAFGNCVNVSSVTIPNGVTRIADWAFGGCQMETLEIPNSVLSIGKYAFYTCESLKNLTLSGNLLSIGQYAFCYCHNLTSIELPNKLTTLDEGAFRYCSGLSSVTIPNSVTSIGIRVFGSCSGLNSIIVASNNSNYSSEDGVLFNKNKTTLLQFPGAKIGSYTIPQGVINIAQEAFMGSSLLLTSIVIPSSVASIGERAFYDCVYFASITCEAVTPPTCGDEVFYEVDKSVCTLYVPAQSITAYQTATGWRDFANILPIQTIHYATIADLYNMAQDSTFTLGAFDVVYVPDFQNGSNMYIKDETGSMVIYKPNYGLQAGDHVEAGLQGRINIYHGLYEVAPVSAKEDLTVTAGDAPAPMVATEVPSATNVNQFVVYKNVSFATDTAFVESKRHAVHGTWNNQQITFYNQYYIGAMLSANKTYNITAVNTIYGTTPQAYPLAVEEVTTDTIEPCHTISGTCGTNLTWELSCDSVLTISGTGAMWDYLNPSDEPWYSYRSSITSLVIEDNVTSISWNFRGLTGLTSVVIGNSITNIGSRAFEGCTGLSSLTIGNHVTSIGTAAFYQCLGLTSIEIPNSVTSIGNHAFWNCFYVTSPVYIHNNVTNIGADAFGACSIPSFEVNSDNSNYCAVDGVLFDKTKHTLIQYPGGNPRTEYTIPETVTSIEYRAFEGAELLTSITIGNNVTSIENEAFSFCMGLTSIEIPNSVTSIERFTFSYCSNLTSVVLPNSIVNINDGAFAYCRNLTSFTNYATTPQTLKDEYVFSDVNLSNCTLYVPAQSIAAYQTADVWKEFGNILPIEEPIVDPTDSVYDVVYLDQAGLQIETEPIILHLPVAPEIEGFTFLKWQVVAGDLENGIHIQAVYTADEPTNAPEVYTNPANKAQKLIRNGKVYILTDDKVYSISGQKVK